MNVVKILIVSSSMALLVSGGLSSCATTVSDGPQGLAKFADDPRLGNKVDRICFSGSIDSFFGAEGDTIVLSKGLGRDYRVRLSGLCNNLEHAQSMALERQSGCASRGDYILVSESPFTLNDDIGLGPDRCYIDEIYEWHKDVDVDEENTGDNP